ncbi:MAG: PEP-CTERM sorting domain-containing protein [Opitutales bacterium]
MNQVFSLAGIACLAVSSSLSAAVSVIDVSSQGASNSDEASKLFEFSFDGSNLSTTATASNDAFVSGGSIDTVGLTGGTFGWTVDGASGWTSTDVESNIGDFSQYFDGDSLTGLTDFGDLGVRGQDGNGRLNITGGGGNNNQTDAQNEAIVFTFDTSGLAADTGLSIETLSFQNYTGGETVDFVFWDFETGEATSFGFGVDANSGFPTELPGDTLAGPGLVTDGDKIFLAANTGAHTFEAITFDLVALAAVPEPSTVVLIAGLAAVAFVSVRRRK